MRITWRLLLPFYHLRYILLEIAIFFFAIIRNLSLSNLCSTSHGKIPLDMPQSSTADLECNSLPDIRTTCSAKEVNIFYPSYSPFFFLLGPFTRFPLCFKTCKGWTDKHSQYWDSIDMVQGQNPPQGGSRKISFNVSDQYDIQDVIGEGAYGVVW
jgi:hypothetical protein